MHLTAHLRASAGSLVRVRLRRQRAQFQSRCRACRATQSEVLSRLLTLNRPSRYASDFGLTDATTSAHLRERVPVSTYDDFRPYVDEVCKGDTDALLGPENRLMMFTLSSGTTSDSKFIPITNRFFSDYRRGWQLWGIAAYDDHPPLKRMNIVQLSSDYNRFQSEGGTPCGNISGMAAVMQRPAVRMLYTLPFAVAKIDKPETKYYTALRLAIADDNVGMVTTANPSTLVHLAQLADASREDLIRDVFDGTLSKKHTLKDDVRAALQRKLSKKNPRRARFLEQVVERTGHLYPKDFWPELQLTAVWTGGSCAAYLPTLKTYFGESPVRDHGLSASEGRMTIPFEDASPDGVLDVTSHYFEFIPEDEYGTDKPTVLEAHELETGRDYFILLTTASGFYRYDICDVVRCTGFYETTPILRFLHKGAHISSITGEKLSESQVVDAVRGTLDEFSHRVEYFTLIPVWGEPPHYELSLDDSELPASEQIPGFEQRLDEQLSQLNCEYQEKRSTGRLKPIRVRRLRPGSWSEFARQRQSRLGGSIEQYKHPCLLPNLETAAQFRKDYGIGVGNGS